MRRKQPLGAIVGKFLCAFCLVWVVGAVATYAQSAAAEPLVVADVYGDPDVSSEAEAASILLRQALAREDRPLITGKQLVDKGGQVRNRITTFDANGAAQLFSATGAQYGLQSELSRDGTKLRMIVNVIDSQGTIVAANTATANSGDLAELVRSTLDGTRDKLGAINSLPTITTLQLTPYAQAEESLVRGDPMLAATRLTTADPHVVIESTAARSLARSIWTSPQLSDDTRIELVGRFGTPQDISALATGSDPRARIARARAQFALADLDAAEKELKGISPTTPDYWVVEAELAHLRGDTARRDKAVAKLVGTPTPAGIAFLSSLPSKTLSPELERQALRAAESLGPEAIHLRTKLAARSAITSIDRDHSLSLITLGDLRPSDIGQLKSTIETAATEGSASALRLRAELKLLDGNLEGASKDLSAARAAGLEDASMWQLQARIYMAQGNHRAAADAYGHAGQTYDQARALRASGDSAGALKVLEGADTPSLLAIELRADVAATPADAAMELASASKLYPLSLEVNRRLATSSKEPSAQASASLVGKMESFMPTLKDNRAVAASATATLKPDAALPTLASDPVLTPMRELLAASGAATFSGRRIAIAWITPDPWLSPVTLDRDAVANVVTKALSGPPFTAIVRASDETFEKNNLGANELSAFTRQMASDGLILIGAHKAGNDMRVEVFVFDPISAKGNGVAATIPKVDWTKLNTRLIGLIVGILSLFLAIGLYIWIRGYGIIEVRIKPDPSGTNEAFRIVVSTLSARPTIGDPNVFRADAKRGGHKRTSKTVDLAGPVTLFRVIPGQWFVHVIGVYDRGDELRLLDDSCSHGVALKRGAHKTIEIDLVPTHADVRIFISDVQTPIVKLWIDGREDATTTMTNRQGEALLKLAVGTYTLVIDGNGTKLTRPISVSSLTIHKIHVNLERERKLAQVSGGLTLERHAVKNKEPEAELARGSRGATSAQADLSLGIKEPAAIMPQRAAPPSVPAAVRLHQAASPEMQTAHLMAAPSMTQGVRISELGGGIGQTTGFGATGFAASMPPATAEGDDISLPGMNTIANLLMGRYQIIAELGRGAMGLVFHAWDSNLERPVAIKVLSPELREHPQAMAFFVQEAKSLAQLNHSNIVSVYDQTSHGSQTFLIMEYVDGTTLEGILRQVKPLPPERALAIVEQLCGGLAYAHSKRVIHRDIKPANIFVSREGVVKLGDFGLARVVNEIAIRKTEVRGTPLYMAPEQVLGTDIDHRADLYAVGCTLFELLTGQPPFIDGAVMYHHVHTPPPAPSSLVPDLIPELDALVLSCLAKDTNERVASAVQLIEGIHRVLRLYGTA